LKLFEENKSENGDEPLKVSTIGDIYYGLGSSYKDLGKFEEAL
jgi:hypothetical protein